ncbi:MAG: glycosyltransferase family 2 protein [Candidatus Omnitrophica bacterium]|nr:glycosyltransferase family 2 protein [Candidatus Omnitrophota bacterium]
MSCDIIMPVWKQLQLTQECVDSVIRHTILPYRFIIIDNGNGLQEKEYLDKLAQNNKTKVMLIRNAQNLGFVKAVNQGLRASNADYVCLLNNDTKVEEGWLEELIDVAENNPRIGIVTPVSGVRGKNKPSKGRWIEIGFATGFCMLIKKEVVQKIGLLDESYGMGYWEDTDYCQRAKNAGYICALAKDCYVYHHTHKTFSLFNKRLTNELFEKNKQYFYSKWGKILRIAYIIPEKKISQAQIDKILSLSTKGHMVYLFIKSSAIIKPAVEHGNIRKFRYPDLIFSLFVALKIWHRQRGKKKFDEIITNSRQIAQRLRFISPKPKIEVS